MHGTHPGAAAPAPPSGPAARAAPRLARAARRPARASASSSPASRSASRRSPACRRSRARSPRGSAARAARSSAATWPSRCIHREAGDAERAFLAAQGRVSSIATMRAMAIAGDKGSGLVEMKAVDAAYPTVGDLVTEPQRPPADLLAERDGAFGAVADPALLVAARSQGRRPRQRRRRDRRDPRQPRLRARQDRERHRLRAALPGLAGGAARRPGLVQPGSLVRWTYRLEPAAGARRPTPVSSAIAAEANQALPGGRAGRSARGSTPIRALPATSSASRNS